MGPPLLVRMQFRTVELRNTTYENVLSVVLLSLRILFQSKQCEIENIYYDIFKKHPCAICVIQNKCRNTKSYVVSQVNNNSHLMPYHSRSTVSTHIQF